jgi:hypothetical protein
VVTMSVKIVRIPSISRCPVTKTPSTFLTQPILQLFIEFNLLF